jgi:5-methylcytosine-specific restriction endonuclease McrA
MGNIRSGGTKSCGNYSCKSVYNRIRDKEAGYKSLIYSYKIHAKKRNIEWHLTYDEFKHFTKQICYYCGREPYSTYQLKDKNGNCRTGIPIIYNGIDRVDSNKNYTIDNCVTACKQCNISKMNYSLEEFKYWVLITYRNLFENGASNTTC